MATTNYSLPTILGTNAFDLVTDYNALANATDSALASVAGLVPIETITEMQGQIGALQTLTGSQGTQITTLQSQMSTANGNISTLQSGLVTANNNIGTLQTDLQGANSNIGTLQTGLQGANSNISEINNKAVGTTLISLGSVSGSKFGTASATYSYNPLINLVIVTIQLDHWSANTEGDPGEQTIGTLPVGMRPSVGLRVLMDYNPVSRAVTQGRVYANGEVTVQNVNGVAGAHNNTPTLNSFIPFYIIPEGELINA